jgi:hypothetical protein
MTGTWLADGAGNPTGFVALAASPGRAVSWDVTWHLIPRDGESLTWISSRTTEPTRPSASSMRR